MCTDINAFRFAIIRESLPTKIRPLKGRFNMIVTSNLDYDLGNEDTDLVDKSSSLEV